MKAFYLNGRTSNEFSRSFFLDLKSAIPGSFKQERITVIAEAIFQKAKLNFVEPDRGYYLVNLV